MIVRIRLTRVGLLASCLAFMLPTFAQNNPPTADQQKNNSGDRHMTQQIRKSVMADKSLSSEAHNVKIITQNGMVTLRGQVKSEDEKKAIRQHAIDAAGDASKVTDEITVKPQ
jgi:osmotically-inducible protein OsmY